MQLNIEYGDSNITFTTSHQISVRGMLDPPSAVTLPDAIQEALQHPIHSRSLLEMGREKIEKNPDATVVIVVSDNTRPVPYYGHDGIIFQLVQILKEAGFSENQVTILIGAGSHRNMEESEVEKMIGLQKMGLSAIQVINHEYDDEDHLISLGYTKRGSHVLINRIYQEADLKIVTGLVESHFMAGASGGRKGICPAIVGKETLTIFHGAKLLSSQQAGDLILTGNPLHEEATEIALMAGCDFIVNVTLDNELKITGVFAGDMIEAHRQAVGKIKEYVTVPLDRKYDIVMIPAGYVGINHYQAAKAAIEASRAVQPGGKIIIIAKNTDVDPIGGAGYKEALRLHDRLGTKEFIRTINAPDWSIIQEQWEVQMWCKVYDVIQNWDHLFYCALEISAEDYSFLPGKAMFNMVNINTNDNPDEQMLTLVEAALEDAIKSSMVEAPSILYLKDGPYGIPEVKE